MKVFLSYAGENRARVRELRSFLESNKQIELDDWEGERSRPSEAIVRSIEDGIVKADAFLAFLSPDYLASGWCRKELALAIHHDSAIKRSPDQPAFIHVLKIEDVDRENLGFLRDIRQVDLAGSSAKDTMEEFARLLATLEPAASPHNQAAAVIPRFRNREDQLQLVHDSIVTYGREDFWVVIAPPQFGKSWFLDHLSFTFPGLWDRRLVDLSRESPDTRSNVNAILSRVFGVDLQLQGGRSLPASIAGRIATNRRSFLCLIDGGELLGSRTARGLRQSLGEIHSRIEKSGAGNRLAVVLASRTSMPGWNGMDPSPRVSPLHLQQFDQSVVRSAVEELAKLQERTFGRSELDKMSADAYRLSAGLPHLLRDILVWLRDTGWADIGELSSRELFETLARPYIEENLLSQPSLLPNGGSRDESPTLEILQESLRIVAPYRLFTMSHLKSGLKLDGDVATLISSIGWSPYQHWDTLTQTSIVAEDDFWYRIIPAIRTLLFRYYHPTQDEQIRAHAAAASFYEQWSHLQPAGGEWVVILGECIWHEACRRTLDGSIAQVEGFLAYVRERIYELTITPILEEREWRRGAARILRRDTELRALLGNVQGLFDMIVEEVSAGEVRRPDDD